MSDTQNIIVEAFERRAEITPRNVETLVRDAVLDTIERLDHGEIRVAERHNGDWVVNDWIKKADPNGHLQMPVSRMIACPNASFGSYRANTNSPNCPIGYSQEETIKSIWR